MIQKLVINILTGDDVLTLLNRILDLLTDEKITEEYLVKFIEELKQSRDTLNSALAKSKISEFTELLKQKDSIRDDAVDAFISALESAVKRRDTTISEAGKLLYKIIQKYGFRFHRGGYSDQTSKMHSILTDLENTEAVNAIKDIKAEDVYEEMKETQADFEALYNEKMDTEAVKDLPRLKESKMDAIKDLNLFNESLNICLRLFPDQYDELVKKIEEAVKDTMTIARARETRKDTISTEDV